MIEDLLDNARLNDNEVDALLSEEENEPVFVKNLENVQGDERDVILFSICYGPDIHGKVAMNFGPMNKEGGERRLNVAITRARREVLVFSTLRADQIDLARTRARGVKDLKNLLEYAERGPSAIAAAVVHDQDADFDSPFEEEVYDALVEKGWVVHKQVGCARYKIDLAVVDPEAPGRYLLGVECDGANYHRAKTASDRDKLREAVLRDLGWELHRIWSSDWWANPKGEIERVEEALLRAQENTGRDEPVVSGPPDPRESSTQSSDGPSQNVTHAEIRPEPELEPEPLPQYQPFLCDRPAGTMEAFYESRAVTRIQNDIIEVVRTEGPVSFTLASKRVAMLWGFERVRRRPATRIRRLIPTSDVKVQETESGAFLWPVTLSPEEYTAFRCPGADGSGARQAEDLPLEEIANAIIYILRSHLSAPADELVQETAKLFGFSRVGPVVGDRFHRAISNLVGRGLVRVDAESVILVESRA